MSYPSRTNPMFGGRRNARRIERVVVCRPPIYRPFIWSYPYPPFAAVYVTPNFGVVIEETPFGTYRHYQGRIGGIYFSFSQFKPKREQIERRRKEEPSTPLADFLRDLYNDRYEIHQDLPFTFVNERNQPVGGFVADYAIYDRKRRIWLIFEDTPEETSRARKLVEHNRLQNVLHVYYAPPFLNDRKKEVLRNELARRGDAPHAIVIRANPKR